MHKSERKGYAEQNERPVSFERLNKLQLGKERPRYVQPEPAAEYCAPHNCGYTAHANDKKQSALAGNGLFTAYAIKPPSASKIPYAASAIIMPKSKK